MFQHDNCLHHLSIYSQRHCVRIILRTVVALIEFIICFKDFCMAKRVSPADQTSAQPLRTPADLQHSMETLQLPTERLRCILSTTFRSACASPIPVCVNDERVVIHWTDKQNFPIHQYLELLFVHASRACWQCRGSAFQGIFLAFDNKHFSSILFNELLLCLCAHSPLC